jgi:hypothetical protein
MAQEREKLILTQDEARAIVFDDHEDYQVIENEIESTSRWSEHHLVTVQRLSDGKYFQDTYSQGLTESQDERAYEYSQPNFTEVFQVTKTIIAYE